ncbi:MAG: hypothetical protein ABI367_11900 [Mucilaginibacter sp.]
MKKILLSIFTLLFSVSCMAQAQLAFPFQGGKDIMTRFFKDSLTVSKDIIKKRATGMAIFKFTADEQGVISKVVIYYADDLLLTPPIIAALKKSTRKWIIPDHEKFHDFLIPFSVCFNAPDITTTEVQKSSYEFYRNRKRFMSTDQIPLNEATLLPAVVISYDLAP